MIESPQELRERLDMLSQVTQDEDVLANKLAIEQVYQLSRIAFRLSDLETQLVTIGEILEDKKDAS